MAMNQVGRRCGPVGGGRDRGFTLIEMLIVLAIVGMIAVIGTIVISKALKRQRLQAAAEDIRGILQRVYTQTTATNQPAFVRIDINNRRIQIVGSTAGTPVLATYILPEDISLSTSSVSGVQCNWPVVNGMPCLECSVRGLALNPTTGAELSQVETLNVTHADMVQGDLRPRKVYTISIYPIWHTQVSESNW
ncbi:MAG: prepilin-type N-terminal cleavage/methylation domain-containing protein [Acidobacteriota bacterium]|jgi:prepilin-type N-terminal cleavage/methylation domain-containing protein